MILQAVAGACSIFLGGLSVRQGDTINKKHSTHLSHARSNSTAAAGAGHVATQQRRQGGQHR